MILNQWRYAILLGVFTIFTARADFEGRVVRILDGDTIETLSASGQIVRIRLAGIDAPEKNQPFGQRSRQALSASLAQRTVLITGDKKDQYGRLLGTVWMEGTDVNALQVKKGMAWAYRFHGKVLSPQYAALEQSARKQTTGLWADPAPVEPWRWRQSQKSEEQDRCRTVTWPQDLSLSQTMPVCSGRGSPYSTIIFDIQTDPSRNVSGQN